MRMKPTMRNRMLHSVLVAAFSAVVAIGAFGGVSGEKSDTRADSVWPAAAQTVVVAGDSVWPVVPAHTDDSVWA